MHWFSDLEGLDCPNFYTKKQDEIMREKLTLHQDEETRRSPAAVSRIVLRSLSLPIGKLETVSLVLGENDPRIPRRISYSLKQI